jgi:hypothetical protein
MTVYFQTFMNICQIKKCNVSRERYFRLKDIASVFLSLLLLSLLALSRVLLLQVPFRHVTVLCRPAGRTEDCQHVVCCSHTLCSTRQCFMATDVEKRMPNIISDTFNSSFTGKGFRCDGYEWLLLIDDLLFPTATVCIPDVHGLLSAGLPMSLLPHFGT